MFGTMRVLGIETSCDETAAAVVAVDDSENTEIVSGKILSNIVYSQIEEHAEFGGVVPELAARAHLSRLDSIIKAALDEAKTKLNELDAVAVTAGPGLVGGLLTGVMTAKAICAATDLPFYAINHLEGHALTARLTDALPFPYLLLLVSGGHSQFVEVRGVGDYRRLATTIDDALGEAFDKTAKLLSLGHPGGPAVEAAAKNGDPTRFEFPRPLSGKDQVNFSFSGLKTAIRQTAQKLAPLNEQDVADICASFQAAITDVLADRTKKMIRAFEEEHSKSGKTLVIAGGVAANTAIRNRLTEVVDEAGWRFVMPPHTLCTDNGAMIAWSALERLSLQMPSDPLDIAPRSRWPLDEKAAGLIGSGRRGVKA